MASGSGYAELSTLVTPAAAVLQALAKTGLPAPQPVTISASIDTGATQTCLPPGTAAKLNLPVAGSKAFQTASAESVPCPLFAVRLTFSTGQYWEGLVAELPAASNHADALIGCDLLAHAVMIYNGPAKTFSICF